MDNEAGQKTGGFPMESRTGTPLDYYDGPPRVRGDHSQVKADAVGPAPRVRGNLIHIIIPFFTPS